MTGRHRGSSPRHPQGRKTEAQQQRKGKAMKLKGIHIQTLAKDLPVGRLVNTNIQDLEGHMQTITVTKVTPLRGKKVQIEGINTKTNETEQFVYREDLVFERPELIEVEDEVED